MNDNVEKDEIIRHLGKQLSPDGKLPPEFSEPLRTTAPLELLKLIFVMQDDCTAKLLEGLPKAFKPADLVGDTEQRRVWIFFARFLGMQRRLDEELQIFECLYEQLLTHQEETRKQIEKTIPLVHMSRCHEELNHPVHAKRYVMLTLCDEAIGHKGGVFVERSGCYTRLVWHFGLADAEYRRYSKEFWKLHQKERWQSRFPEWCLQRVDQHWMTEVPSATEVGLYKISRPYARWLLDQTQDKEGKTLEHLAQYLVGTMPGCRAMRRVKSETSDYDVVGVFEGSFMDFRAEVGRYFLVECKDWATPADFTTVAKFCRVLDSTKCRFGILFSRVGVSGRKRTQHGQREIVKVFQDRGIVIVVVDKDDLERVVSGANFLSMLRAKYEKVRLDLPG